MTDDIVQRLRAQRPHDDLCTEAADQIDLWRGVAQKLAQEVLQSFDGHRTTSQMQAYADYLKAKG
jgi:hypothetical protein